jgi:hypothetical protein
MTQSTGCSRATRFMPYIFFFAPNGYYKGYLSPLIPANNVLFDSKNGDIALK